MAEEYLSCCLYFTASKLCRAINKLAEEEFRITGLSPTHAFLLMIVNEKNGVSPTEISEKLHVTPSTITRFVDKLENQGLVKREFEGRNALLSSTEKGKNLQEDIKKAWENLYHRYSKILGYQEGSYLAKIIHEAGTKLEEA